MRKVAIIVPNSFPVPPIRGGGIQTAVAATTPHYKEFKPYVFCLSEYGLDNLPLKETVGNIEYRRICQSPLEELWIRVSHLSTRNYFPYIREICKQIKEIKPDIIHLMNRPWFLPIMRRALGKEPKIILHHFNNYLMEMPRFFAGRFLSMTNGFIGCSKYTVNAEVIERFPEYKDGCVVISNGVDTSKFDPAKIDQGILNGLRAKYGINKGDVVISYVGRLSEGKGALELLKAVKKLVVGKGQKQVKLMLVGSSFYGGETKTTPFIEALHKVSADIKDNIIFTGFINRDNIQNAFALCDILAIPSIVQDASPIVAYEGAAMNLPIVGTRRGGIPELVEEGQLGLIVDDPFDTDGMAEKLGLLVNDPAKRKRYGENGRKFMVTNYDWKIVAHRAEEAYKFFLRK